MKKCLLLLVALTGFLFSVQAQVGFNNLSNLSRPPLFGPSPFQDSLWAVDTLTHGVVYRAAPFPSTGGSITGINGMAMHPHTGELFVVCKQSAVSGRTLGKYNIITGQVTIIGNLGDNFSSITFRSDGQLFGVTGDGATASETLFTIDTSTATPTIATALGNGADGEVVCYNFADDMLYHWSGNGTVVFEKLLSAPPYTVTGIPIIGTTNGETFGAAYLGNNRFRISNISSTFNHCFANGQWTSQFGGNPDDLRGLGMTGRWVDRPGNDTICANDSALFEAFATLGGSGRHKFQWVHNGVNIPGATSSTYYGNQTGWYNCRVVLDSLYASSLDSSITPSTDTAWYGRYLHVNNIPVVNITPGPTEYLCQPGDSILLTGTSGGTSQWYYNGGIVVGANTNTLYVNVPGVYNMVKTNLNGCSDSAAVGTSIMFAPTTSISPGDDICFGDSVALITTAGASVYNWLESGALFTTTASETLYVNTTGNYSVETNFGSCIDTTSVSVVNVAPEYNVTPNGSNTICDGTNVVLTATPGGSSYQWLSNGVPIPGATSNVYTADTTGDFSVIITYPGCTDTSVTSLNLTVIDCSGLEENNSTSLHIYPNPASNFIQIASEAVVETVEIRDMLGRSVINVTVNSTNPIVAIDALPKGMYLVSISTGSLIKTARFIKN